MTVHCKQCNHQWEFPIKLPMDLTRFVKALNGMCAVGCPSCGADGDNVLCGPTVFTRAAGAGPGNSGALGVQGVPGGEQ